MFFAPEGAIQFVLEPKRHHPMQEAVVAHVGEPCEPVPIWVGPAIKATPPCGCPCVYPVILESLRPEHLAVVMTAMAGKSAIFVCNHTGKVIE